ncbi:glucose-6-phosphate dehydrogenase (coenzyme-F420) [Ferrovibrio sp.]|uniref:glucose-6-phosphate dehydrogenase (coenzyme-F420) n=1 Tax=Ferrovibrio sp. TaxID=1917215 RepID=UPI0025C3BB9C|nr:glucose-6-phosphate dehydrogenase (coenzyme-F420) [Ferrovibrio sp.]MBX3453626.1 glucose-6-phosphate dehydrogenase (coenzyme-F420) [Ferrovibrio sp.]
MLKLGYKASAEQFTPSKLLDFAVLAEQSGFDSVFVSDHFQPWRHTGGHAPYSFAWMGAVGARTNRILIGTSVATPTFRYHPSVVAQAVGTLGSMFPDRIILGVGTGESLNEVPALGMKWPGFKERFGRLKESIELMNKLWREDRVSFEGTYYRTENATIYDKPENPVPIYVAAAGPTASVLAGEVAAGFICTSGKAPELYRETLLPNVDAGLKAAGRAPDSIDRMIEVKVSFDTDLQQAKEDTRFWAALALSAEEKTSVKDALEMERLADALPLDRAASRWIVSVDPDEQVERIRPYVELGFRHLVFHAPGPDQAKFIKLYSEKVFPKLRKAFG